MRIEWLDNIKHSGSWSMWLNCTAAVGWQKWTDFAMRSNKDGDMWFASGHWNTRMEYLGHAPKHEVRLQQIFTRHRVVGIQYSMHTMAAGLPRCTKSTMSKPMQREEQWWEIISSVHWVVWIHLQEILQGPSYETYHWW